MRCHAKKLYEKFIQKLPFKKLDIFSKNKQTKIHQKFRQIQEFFQRIFQFFTKIVIFDKTLLVE